MSQTSTHYVHYFVYLMQSWSSPYTAERAGLSTFKRSVIIQSLSLFVIPLPHARPFHPYGTDLPLSLLVGKLDEAQRHPRGVPHLKPKSIFNERLFSQSLLFLKVMD
jgi:hypothetical protein